MRITKTRFPWNPGVKKSYAQHNTEQVDCRTVNFVTNACLIRVSCSSNYQFVLTMFVHSSNIRHGLRGHGDFKHQRTFSVSELNTSVIRDHRSCCQANTSIVGCVFCGSCFTPTCSLHNTSQTRCCLAVPGTFHTIHRVLYFPTLSGKPESLRRPLFTSGKTEIRDKI